MRELDDLIEVNNYKFERKKKYKITQKKNNILKNQINKTKKKKVKGKSFKDVSSNQKLKKIIGGAEKPDPKESKDLLKDESTIQKEFNNYNKTLGIIEKNLETERENLIKKITEIIKLADGVIDTFTPEFTGFKKSAIDFIRSKKKKDQYFRDVVRIANKQIQYLETVYNIRRPKDFGKYYARVGFAKKPKDYVKHDIIEDDFDKIKHFYKVPTPSYILNRRGREFSEDNQKTFAARATGLLSTKVVSTYTGSKIEIYPKKNLLHYKIAKYRERELQFLMMEKKSITNLIIKELYSY